MKHVLDPLRASERISDDYVRYLRSAFLPSDPDLRRDFEAQLSEGKRLTRGPILQAQAPYAPSATVRQLISEGVLHPGLERLGREAFDLDRPLYVHQEQAVRKIRNSRNLIVATGTGSGKTESFLIPILDALLREADTGEAAQPGVRALLLYPMNALVNDQLLRLRTMLAQFPEFTFGRYVGDTEHTRQKALAQHKHRFQSDPLDNELICRDEMKATPPHVLVTNFAMLEYLLLRPEDQSFFDRPTGSRWRFVVLDEVHVYNGAKGAEIGMLLRRVRDRVRQSGSGRLTYIGTSATLGKGDDDLPRLAHFGRQVFDENVEWDPSDPDRQDVVQATRTELISGTSSWFCEESRMIELRDAFRTDAAVASLFACIEASGPPAPESLEAPRQWLGRAFATETHVIELQHMLADESVDLHDAAQRVMSGPDRGANLTALVDLCVAAEDELGKALLPARWHFLLRALEGAFVCLHPEHPPEEPRLLLTRHRACPGCRSRRRESTMFEAAVCKRCGARHVVGERAMVDEVQILGSPRMGSEDAAAFLVLGDGADSSDPEDDDDDDALASDATEHFDPAVICPQCGALGQSRTQCGCSVPVIRLREVKPANREQPIRRCAACGGRSSSGPILQRFLTGADAPVAVIATSLYQELPPAGRVKGGVGDGRKLLSFADSRQDAAFFAPYLERTYNRAVQRRLLWKTLTEQLEEGADELRMPDLVVQLKNQALATGIIDDDPDKLAPASQVRHWLYAEMVGFDRRLSLEGVGLAEIAVPVPRGLAAPEPLTSLGLSAQEAFDLVQVLLESVRRNRAVTVSSDVDLDDPIFEGAPMTGMRSMGSEPRVISWSPVRGVNRRLTYLRRVVEELGHDPEQARDLLHDIWEHWLTSSDWSDVLVGEEDPYGKGVLHRLKAERLLFRPVTNQHRPGRCGVCREVWWHTVRGICPGARCSGRVEAFDPFEARDHYRELYTSLDLIGLRVEEHTAQLTNAAAAARQQEFVEGKINALSCSTTFELGVDVGAIQAVLMRNVPPSPANYVQRAGRAGRRSGSPALVVTFAQRRSHDQQLFDRPLIMIDGHVAPPTVNVSNPAIVRRHVAALAFAAYLRRLTEDDHDESVYKTVDGFFAPTGSSTADRMMEWLHEHPAEVGEAIRRIVPPAVLEDADLGISSWAWLDFLDGDPHQEGKGKLEIAGREIRRELAQVDAEVERAVEKQQFKRAGYLQGVRKTIASGRTIDRLARVGVLPKYGFPVDVVDLDLGTETRVELSRDLAQAVAEFAPGNQLVADKRVWEGAGLRIEPGLRLLVHRLSKCRDCGAQWTWLEILEEPPDCPSCGATGTRGDRLVQPRFGFIGRDTGRRPGDRRPPKVAWSTSFFDDYEGPPPEPVTVPVGDGKVITRLSRQGRITVVNRGRGGGYDFCDDCGFIREASNQPLEKHERPAVPGLTTKKTTCTTFLKHASLGHWYLTDCVQIDLPSVSVSDEPRLKSLLAALLAAVEEVGIEHNDVNGSIGRRSSVVIFDSVPGGAGHARRIAEVLPELFASARRITESCECGADTSCYGCLRSYRNQTEHDLLERRLALEVLDQIGVR